MSSKGLGAINQSSSQSVDISALFYSSIHKSHQLPRRILFRLRLPKQTPPVLKRPLCIVPEALVQIPRLSLDPCICVLVRKDACRVCYWTFAQNGPLFFRKERWLLTVQINHRSFRAPNRVWHIMRSVSALETLAQLTDSSASDMIR